MAGDKPQHPRSVFWRPLIEAARGRVPPPIRAHSFVWRWDSKTWPVALRCSDGQRYVVKAIQRRPECPNRVIVSDQIASRLGAMLGAPVGAPALVDVPQDLIDAEPEMAHMEPGLAHATRWIPNCQDLMFRPGVGGPNRLRALLIGVLWGWCEMEHDHQLIREKQPPQLLHAVDHGSVFPGMHEWCIRALRAPPPARLDAWISTGCTFSETECADACPPLGNLTPEIVAEAVAAPPLEWPISEFERIALAVYLWRRRRDLLGYLPCADRQAEV